MRDSAFFSVFSMAICTVLFLCYLVRKDLQTLNGTDGVVCWTGGSLSLAGMDGL